MRKKELKLIITFESTVQAMRLERAAKEAKAPGRLIPVPREITAGCGLAYCATPTAREELILLIQKYGLTAEQIVELVI
jgi:hypothetical protein